jgi:uncharacterized protein YndB with AHSA1/START domain
MAESQFVHVTYIRATAEKLWQALTEPEFTRRYWFDTTQESERNPGASWRIIFADGRTADSGKIVEIDALRRLLLTWRHELDAGMRAEGYSRLSYELEQQGEAVKLTVRHEMTKSGSKFIEAVSTGWPPILSSLKSLLETGEPLNATSHSPKGM